MLPEVHLLQEEVVVGVACREHCHIRVYGLAGALLVYLDGFTVHYPSEEGHLREGARELLDDHDAVVRPVYDAFLDLPPALSGCNAFKRRLRRVVHDQHLRRYHLGDLMHLALGGAYVPCKHLVNAGSVVKTVHDEPWCVWTHEAVERQLPGVGPEYDQLIQLSCQDLEVGLRGSLDLLELFRELLDVRVDVEPNLV